jgi:hypothetical protein
MTKKALITGIAGQDGSYLCELVLAKQYEVHGLIRRSRSFTTARIEPFYKDQHLKDVRMFLHYGDHLRLPQVHARAVPGGRPLEWIPGGDKRSLRHCQENPAGDAPGLPATVWHARHLSAAGKPVRPGR